MKIKTINSFICGALLVVGVGCGYVVDNNGEPPDNLMREPVMEPPEIPVTSTVVVPPAEPEPVCGNGEIEEGEGCDDGNVIAGDGCDDECQMEVSQRPDTCVMDDECKAYDRTLVCEGEVCVVRCGNPKGNIEPGAFQCFPPDTCLFDIGHCGGCLMDDSCDEYYGAFTPNAYICENSECILRCDSGSTPCPPTENCNPETGRCDPLRNVIDDPTWTSSFVTSDMLSFTSTWAAHRGGLALHPVHMDPYNSSWELSRDQNTLPMRPGAIGPQRVNQAINFHNENFLWKTRRGNELKVVRGSDVLFRYILKHNQQTHHYPVGFTAWETSNQFTALGDRWGAQLDIRPGSFPGGWRVLGALTHSVYPPIDQWQLIDVFMDFSDPLNAHITIAINGDVQSDSSTGVSRNELGGDVTLFMGGTIGEAAMPLGLSHSTQFFFGIAIGADNDWWNHEVHSGDCNALELNCQ